MFFSLFCRDLEQLAEADIITALCQWLSPYDDNSFPPLSVLEAATTALTKVFYQQNAILTH